MTICCHLIGCDFALRCSVLVDSHACDEKPWQEPREYHRPSHSSLPGVAGQQSTTKVADHHNRKRVKQTTGLDRRSDLRRHKEIIEVNHGHQVSIPLLPRSCVPLKLPAANLTRNLPCTKVTLSENHQHHKPTTLTDQMSAAITWLRRDGVH